MGSAIEVSSAREGGDWPGAPLHQWLALLALHRLSRSTSARLNSDWIKCASGQLGRRLAAANDTNRAEGVLRGKAGPK